MDFYLFIMIAVAIVLHVGAHFAGKYRKLLSVINILYHICSFGIIAWCGLELIDLLIFFLVSTIAAHIFVPKEV